jgi:hypothetical protein
MISLHPELANSLDLPEKMSCLNCPFCYTNLHARYYGISILQCQCNNDFSLLKNREKPEVYFFDSVYFSIFDCGIISTPFVKNVKLLAADRLEVPLICLDFTNLDRLRQRIKLYLSHEYY